VDHREEVHALIAVYTGYAHKEEQEGSLPLLGPSSKNLKSAAKGE